MTARKRTNTLCVRCKKPVWHFTHNPLHPALRDSPAAHDFVESGEPKLVVPTNVDYTPTFKEHLFVFCLVITVLGLMVLVGNIPL